MDVMNTVVVMGVSGCGKSTFAKALAARIEATFIDADDFHSPENIARMRAGIALTDADRAPWLAALSARLAQGCALGERLVLACSALKRAYRDVLREGAPALVLVHLTGSPELLAARLDARQAHYMSPALLASQLAILEPPGPGERAVTLDVAESPKALIEDVVTQLRA